MKQVRTIAIFLVLLITFNYANGQDDVTLNEYVTKSAKQVEKPNAFLFAPFNFFDIVNPNFQIGYERFVARRWSLQIDGAIMVRHSIFNVIIDWANGIKVSECPYTNKGFRVKGSVKYFLVDKRIFKLYFSPELFFYKNKSGIVSTFLISDPDFEYSFGRPEEGQNGYDMFFYNDEEKMGVNFKTGIKLLLGKYFFIEPHLGLGFAYRNVIRTGIENPNDEVFDNLFGIFDSTAPNKWAPTLPFNFKLGVRF